MSVTRATVVALGCVLGARPSWSLCKAGGTPALPEGIPSSENRSRRDLFPQFKAIVSSLFFRVSLFLYHNLYGCG